MQVIDTTRLRQEWVDEQLEKYVTLSRFAEKLGVPPSTASRWIQPGKEATGRVIGSVLNLSLIHISEPTRPVCSSRMPSAA